MNFSVEQIKEIISATLIGTRENIFSEIITDSRTSSFSSRSLFVAIKGERHDGHRYLEDVYMQGCRCFIISEMTHTFESYQDASFLFVPDTLLALQQLAAYRRSLFSVPVIGITGSNGKTIVKEWLWQLLLSDYHICKNPKSYNSQMGVPLSVWQLNEKNTLALFEAGISLPGEMEKLERIIRPTIGLITNIGSAHDENFSDYIEKTREKLKLFLHCEILIYCKDYESIGYCLRNSFHNKQKQVTWSFLESADLHVFFKEVKNAQTHLKALYKGDELSLKIPFTDQASVENCIHCWLLMLQLNYANEVIQHRMLALESLGMRLEMKQGLFNCTLINDSYSNDIHSLSIALDFLKQQKQQEHKVVILSDILQTGKNKLSLYEEVNNLFRNKEVSEFIGIGDDISAQSQVFSVKKTFFKNTSAFIEAYRKGTLGFQNAVILIKGARSFGFERIHKLLQQKSHDTVLEINLNNLVQNLNYYRSKLKPETAIMPMVKAFSYGSGSFEIANALQHNRVHYFAVAYADEGVELRKNGVEVPILVMNPEPQSLDQMLEYHLEPEIFSFNIWDQIENYLNQRDNKSVFPVHLKIDTGMHRLGFEASEIPDLKNKLKQSKRIQIKSIFSHLVASDDEKLDDFTHGQIQVFDNLSLQLTEILPYKVLRHICNSGAISRFPEAHFDMVRLGIGLYGVGVNPAEQIHLKSVSTLKTTVSQIKQVKEGDTVGDSRKGKMTKAGTIATLPIGYADGLNRKLGNGVGHVYIKGKAVPLIGNVCMDMCMVDITGIDVKEGDEVVVFDSAEHLQDLSRILETIPYEILTSVSARVKRIYLQE